MSAPEGSTALEGVAGTPSSPKARPHELTRAHAMGLRVMDRLQILVPCEDAQRYWIDPQPSWVFFIRVLADGRLLCRTAYASQRTVDPANVVDHRPGKPHRVLAMPAELQRRWRESAGASAKLEHATSEWYRPATITYITLVGRNHHVFDMAHLLFDDPDVDECEEIVRTIHPEHYEAVCRLGRASSLPVAFPRLSGGCAGYGLERGRQADAALAQALVSSALAGLKPAVEQLASAGAEPLSGPRVRALIEQARLQAQQPGAAKRWPPKEH